MRASVAAAPLLVLLLAIGCSTVLAGCPFRHLAAFGAPEEAPGWAGRALLQATQKPQFDANATRQLNLKAVKADLTALMTDSKDFWPADNGHYGGLMIRLAWHCSGSYRTWDGRGGCNGARIRFLPELAWDDNTNLNKARQLLVPIKDKYGPALSWGDLITLAGGVAIESMGGPNTGICLGRVDDVDGTASLPLGPTPEQQLIAPCKTGNGMCEQPLGQTTMGLIYVNPEGVLGVPEPAKSVAHIRGTFGRMGMNDSETVALIGGGHAFGKTHGACPTGAGPGPKQNPSNPWPGTCGSGADKGKGANTFTSGFEGAWTTTPTKWDNQFFNNLLDFEWMKHKGPGGHWQWKAVNLTASGAKKQRKLPGSMVMMLTTDIALTRDPEYLKLVKLYAADLGALTRSFGAAWYKLMTRSMGPVTRCLGSDVPRAQAFQLPLPQPSGKQPDWAKVRADVLRALGSGSSKSKAEAAALTADVAALAWQSASTFRATDFAGGANGGRIRFSPQKDWPANRGLVDPVLAQLKPVKDAHPDLSWADLIVLAGTLAVEQAAGVQAAAAGSIVAAPFSFCPGRTDAADAAGTDHLAPRNYTTPAIAFKDSAVVQGLTARDAVVLAARPRSARRQQQMGYSGTWSQQAPALSNAYFKALLRGTWKPVTSASGKQEFRAAVAAAERAPGGGDYVFMTSEDLVIKQDPALAAIAAEYAASDSKFLADFAAAWTKAMNADRFDGPVRSVCPQPLAASG